MIELELLEGSETKLRSKRVGGLVRGDAIQNANCVDGGW